MVELSIALPEAAIKCIVHCAIVGTSFLPTTAVAVALATIKEQFHAAFFGIHPVAVPRNKLRGVGKKNVPVGNILAVVYSVFCCVNIMEPLAPDQFAGRVIIKAHDVAVIPYQRIFPEHRKSKRTSMRFQPCDRGMAKSVSGLGALARTESVFFIPA